MDLPPDELCKLVSDIVQASVKFSDEITNIVTYIAQLCKKARVECVCDFLQMVWFRECWHEEVLRQLRQGLTKCYQVAFETRGDGKQSLSYSVVNYDLIIRLEIGKLLGEAVMSRQKWAFSLSISVPWSQKNCPFI